MQSATRAAMAPSSAEGGGGWEEVAVVEVVAPLADAEAMVISEEGAVPALATLLLLLPLLLFLAAFSIALLATLVLLGGAGGLREALGVVAKETARSIV
jgi:hypothetical protein